MTLWIRITSLCCFALPLFLTASSPLTVEVSAKGAILMNTETGAVLWEKNAHTPLHPASITKVFTATFIAEKKNVVLDEMITASNDAVSIFPPSIRRAVSAGHPPYRLETGGTHMGIKAGETLPMHALIYGLMLSSANDAANVISQHLSGDISVFMEELNQFVREKGCKNTVLQNPHGLFHENHKTSAYDMALMGREYLRHSLLREVARTTKYIRPQTNKQPESILHQHNALIRPGRFYYPKAIGIKTGHIYASGFTLVAAAQDSNRKLIAVLLGCETIEQRYKDAIALFEAGFNEKKVSRTLFSKGFDLFNHQIQGGNIPLQAYLSQDIVLDYYPSEEPVFKTAVLWQAPAFPISSGQKVGELQVSSPTGTVLASAPIYAVRHVDATLSYRMNLAWQKVKRSVWDNVTLVMATSGILILASTFYYSHRPLKRKRSKSHKEK